MPYFYLKKAPGRQELDFDFATPYATPEPKMPYFYRKSPPTEESIKITFFCRTKGTSEP